MSGDCQRCAELKATKDVPMFLRISAGQLVDGAVITISGGCEHAGVWKVKAISNDQLGIQVQLVRPQ